MIDKPLGYNPAVEMPVQGQMPLEGLEVLIEGEQELLPNMAPPPAFGDNLAGIRWLLNWSPTLSRT